MIGIVVLSLLAAVSANHLAPFLPYPRVEPVNRVYDFRFDPYLRREVPIYDPRTVVDHASFLHASYGNVLQAPANRFVLPSPYPLVNRGVAPVVPGVPTPTVVPGPIVRDVNYPYYYPFIDRLPHLPVQAPIVPGLPVPAPPAPVITSLDALPASVPLLPSTTPLVHPGPFTPFIPQSTLVAPLPVGIKEEEKKVVEEPVKTEIIEEKKEEIERKEPVIVGDEKFSHEFIDENGTVVKEEGALVDNVLIKKGRYSYKSPEGIPVEIKYIADQNGYRVL